LDQAVKVTRTDHTDDELPGLAAKSRDMARVRRLLAIALTPDGLPRTEAARQSDTDRSWSFAPAG
jgi:hypothetical protein